MGNELRGSQTNLTSNELMFQSNKERLSVMLWHNAIILAFLYHLAVEKKCLHAINKIGSSLGFSSTTHVYHDNLDVCSRSRNLEVPRLFKIPK